MPTPIHRREPSTWRARRAMQLLAAQAHVLQAARLVELDFDPEAQRTARVLFRVAFRLRGDRLARERVA